MSKGPSRAFALSAALASCMAVAEADAQTLPLLDQATVRAPLAAACEGKPDSTPLPIDPRKLVKEGVNSNPAAAIQFNAYFVDLHDPPAPYLNKLPAKPKTCGEFRASAQRGRINLESRQYFQAMALPSEFHYVYRQWGLLVRPPDFQEQLAKRYGLYPAPFRNPYPLPGEDPNRTNGGSGQLPLGLIQGKDEDGRWTGLIGASCSACHDSRLGTTSESSFVWGLPNSANDAGLLASDMFRTTFITSFGNLLPIPWSSGRGSNDAIALISLLPALFDMDNLMLAPSPFEYVADAPHGGMTKAPAWFHRAFKTRQFWEGALTSDNVHSEMAFGVANILRNASKRRALRTEFEDINNFLISMSPPKYPKTINTALAEQGAVIFHERDLWANGANASIPKQPGNGSCASCHGVYSPRHANDMYYLSDPRLKGVAGVITPIETIRTDPRRMRLMADERQRRAWNASWWAYNELNPSWTGYPSESLLASEARRIPRAVYNNGGPIYSPLGPNQWIEPTGYVAPPLYGTWAMAPYFHNGSVPDLWGVLKPSARPKVWKRPYTAAGWGGKNQGYDYSFASYDFQKMGWKYTAMNCSNSIFTSPFLPCDHGMSPIDAVFSMFSNVAAEQFNLAYQSPPPITDQQIKSRMVYNSYLYGNDNGGHDFTQSLTDTERWAIIEYLKTL